MICDGPMEAHILPLVVARWAEGSHDLTSLCSTVIRNQIHACSDQSIAKIVRTTASAKDHQLCFCESLDALWLLRHEFEYVSNSSNKLWL